MEVKNTPRVGEFITILATPFFDFGRAPPGGDGFKPKGLVEGTRAFGGGR